MENINTYLTEKLKISSKSKIINQDDITEKYCLIMIYENGLFKEFKKYFSDSYIIAPAYGDAFIIEPYELINYYDNRDIDIYNIPERYKDKTLEEFKEDFENNKVKPGELKIFNYKKFLKDNLQ
ncbi:hypothetical protein IKN40_02650 [bacterium]|nr:hypothetical protein [bacterium]